MIPFNKAPYTGNEDKYIKQALKTQHLSGGGKFTSICENWFEKKLGFKKALLTSSCTAALEMSAILINIQPGDEVIMPSYTFVSTANAFVLRGAKVKFVDIRPDTMNIDETKIENAITNKTKAIVVVHYASVSAEMDSILKVAEKYNLFVIEDAAQGIFSKYKNKYLGTIGDIGAFSFHDTKNITSGGEGGLIIINNENFIERAEIIREKGTNRNSFIQGKVDKYTWVDIGSSYLISELQAAYLWGQLEISTKIINDRLNSWNLYYKLLLDLEKQNIIELPKIPISCIHNGHIFYIKTKDFEERNELLNFLKNKNIHATFHYVPLHSSPAGKKYGEFIGKDKFTTAESERLLRLPLFYGIKEEEIKKVVKTIKEFYNL